MKFRVQGRGEREKNRREEDWGLEKREKQERRHHKERIYFSHHLLLCFL
jgi:hypothetical protein